MKEFLEALNTKRLRSYDADPDLVKEHFGIEETVLAGGYGYRQILELVQNGADALLEASECVDSRDDENRIQVLLRGRRLYVANTGAPLSEKGLDACLRSHYSPKRGNQIGRFGLGFKSLLKLEGRIDFFTRHCGAIRFDPSRCRAELEARYQITNTPGLRLAWPLDDQERLTDTVVDELAWAETIVRIEIGADELVEHIRQEIRSFPAEFLLFFPVATTLSLNDGEESMRVVRIEHQNGEHLLHNGGAVSRWRVASREARIDEPNALADATHIHARETVPLAWAVPVQGRREEVGRFWAFFPTHTHTYVPGILNAPWKLNSDRNGVIGGEWNDALMVEAAQLIAEALPDLWTEEDPGRPLDGFPRRLDRQDEDAAPLVEALWALLENAAVVPDATGNLQQARALMRHPRDNKELAVSWQSLAGENRCRLVHADCLDRQRAGRLNILAERLVPSEEDEDEDENGPALCRSDVENWFGLAATEEVTEARAVLRLAEAFAEDCKPHEWNRVRSRLAIIPSQSGRLVTSARAVLAPEGVRVPGRATVAVALADNSESRRILRDVLGVSELDEELWTRLLVEALQIPDYPEITRDNGWVAFWSRLRRAPAGVRKEFLSVNANRIRVRRCDGSWVPPDRVLLPGDLVAADDTSSNRNVLVDDEFHSRDRSSLLAIGVSEMPQGDTGVRRYSELPEAEPLLNPWRNACRSLYKETHNVSARRDYLYPRSLSMPRGYSLLAELVGRAKSRWTLELLKRLQDREYSRKTLDFGHTTMAVYPRMRMQHPLSWYVLEHGSIDIGDCSVRLVALVVKQVEPALVNLPEWERLSNILELREPAFPKVEFSKADLRNFWKALFRALVTEEYLTDDSLAALWSGAALDGVVPTELPSAAGMVPIGDVLVTTSVDLARRARAEGYVAAALDEPTLRRWVAAGARDLSTLVEIDWAATSGPPEHLLCVLPEFGDVLSEQARDTARCQSVVGLRLRIGGSTQPVPCLLSNGVLHIDGERIPMLSRVERLELLLAEMNTAGWLSQSPDEALRLLGDSQVDARRAHVAAGATLVERLLRAVGDRPEPLRESLGEPLSGMDFILECTLPQLAELTLAQLGPATLTVLRDALDAEGLQPPTRWNTAAALAFVAAIGFPPEFASSAQARREPEELISGPMELPQLHEFQEEVFEGLRALLAGSAGRRRAVVSLPTGGGKTRVTVETAVRLVLVPEGANRSVVWIAQTDELCEQAVQAFRQVWVNLGARRTDLRIVRLWGGNPNPVGQELDRPVVVVSSIQTLNSRFGAAPLDWLRRPGLVVVDECHHAITPSYSALLRWLDAEASRREDPDREEPPIVGLSATPFRTDDDESQRLARRFDGRWLPSDQAGLYARLLREGVLAEARYEPLDSGAGLTDEELANLEDIGDQWEGLDFENLLQSINQRLAGDTERNQRLLACIEASRERSVLFFANSVAHAEEMAARLNLAGVGAAAISGATPRVARRYFLDRFQDGDIQVLCNHSVLTTGFDAPKTDMILIARQVFSPVRYMQMVGRGLRGEQNGGTASCRIVTVIDNLGRFQNRHPYHYCREYFSEMERISA